VKPLKKRGRRKKERKEEDRGVLVIKEELMRWGL